MFKLTKEKEKIYLLCFDDRYDCCMYFLRYQEYYESPNQKFYRKQFTIVSYMDWYIKHNKRKFSDYKDKITNLFKNLPISIKNKITQNLIKNGYAESLVIDEVQAYISKNELNYIFPD